MRFATWCWWVRRKASRNLLHCSSEVRRSITASVLLYAALTSLRMSSYCLWVSTSRLSSSSSSPKSGSMMSDSRDLNFTTESKMWGESPAIITLHCTVRLSNWIKSKIPQIDRLTHQTCYHSYGASDSALMLTLCALQMLVLLLLLC